MQGIISYSPQFLFPSLLAGYAHNKIVSGKKSGILNEFQLKNVDSRAHFVYLKWYSFAFGTLQKPFCLSGRFLSLCGFFIQGLKVKRFGFSSI